MEDEFQLHLKYETLEGLISKFTKLYRMIRCLDFEAGV